MKFAVRKFENRNRNESTFNLKILPTDTQMKVISLELQVSDSTKIKLTHENVYTVIHTYIHIRRICQNKTNANK